MPELLSGAAEVVAAIGTAVGLDAITVVPVRGVDFPVSAVVAAAEAGGVLDVGTLVVTEWGH
jgi:hypothetical protein